MIHDVFQLLVRQQNGLVVLFDALYVTGPEKHCSQSSPSQNDRVCDQFQLWEEFMAFQQRRQKEQPCAQAVEDVVEQ